MSLKFKHQFRPADNFVHVKKYSNIFKEGHEEKPSTALEVDSVYTHTLDGLQAETDSHNILETTNQIYPVFLPKPSLFKMTAHDNVSDAGDYKNSLEIYKDDIAISVKAKVKAKGMPNVFFQESDEDESVYSGTDLSPYIEHDDVEPILNLPLSILPSPV